MPLIEPKKVKLNLPQNIEPWHVEVKLIDNKYEILLNCFDNQIKEKNVKFLLSSKSDNPEEWNNFGKSIERPNDKTKWNSQMIYRSSFIKIKDNYIVYYSAMSTIYNWRIGLAVGKNLNNLKYF